MSSNRGVGALPVVAVLGAIVVAGAILLGPVRYEGARWNPQFAAPDTVATAPMTIQNQPVATMAPDQEAMSALSINMLLVLWICAGLLVVIIGFLVVRWLRARLRRRLSRVRIDDEIIQLDSAAWDDKLDLPLLRRGLDRARDELDDDRNPRDAIIRAWLGLQEAAEDSGIVRGAAETPTEFTGRILGSVTSDDRDVAALLNLYLRVRFGEKPATDADVALARSAIDRLAADWAAVRESASAEPGGEHGH